MDSLAGQALNLVPQVVHAAKQHERNNDDIASLKQKLQELVPIAHALEITFADQPNVYAALKEEIAVVEDYIQRFENPSLVKQGMKIFRGDRISETMASHDTELHNQISRTQLKLITHLLTVFAANQSTQHAGQQAITTQLTTLSAGMQQLTQTMREVVAKMNTSTPETTRDDLLLRLKKHETALEAAYKPDVKVTFFENTTVGGNVQVGKVNQKATVGTESVQLSAFSGVTIEGDLILDGCEQTVTVDTTNTSSALVKNKIDLANNIHVTGNVAITNPVNQQGNANITAFSGSTFRQNFTANTVNQTFSAAKNNG